MEEVSGRFGDNLIKDFDLIDENSEDPNSDYETTINSMMEKVNNLWHCKVCGKEYVSKQKTNLKQHIEAKHATGFRHICDICGKSCSSKISLVKHTSRYHKIDVINH